MTVQTITGLATVTDKVADDLATEYRGIVGDERQLAKRRKRLGTRIATMMRNGASRRDIARALGVADQTVTNLSVGRNTTTK